MVCGFVYEQETPVPEEKRRKQGFCTFAVGERGKRADKRAGINTKEAEFAFDLPVFGFGSDGAQHVEHSSFRAVY